VTATLWHLTDDAARTPARPVPGELVTLRIGSWPASVDDVRVEVIIERGHAIRREARAARVVAGTGQNRFWEAELGRFELGDRVTYSITGNHDGHAVRSRAWSFRVGARARVALIWHHHQPCYQAVGAGAVAGALHMPWVRLHALRDYLGMALRVRAVAGIDVVFNLTPSLLAQLAAYEDGATDRALDLTLTPAERLGDRERDELVRTFFDADWHRQIFVHPRYRELFDAREAGRALDVQQLRDLQMWFNLAWCCHELRTGDVALPGGESASVARFVAKGRDFTVDDIAAMVAEQRKVLKAIVPLYRELAEAGRVELTTTPYYHPILPILVDPGGASVDRDGAATPAGLSFGDDAEAQVARAVRAHAAWFGRPPAGLWPAEGAVSEAMLPLLARHGVRWIATDQGVLARSGQWGYEAARPSVRHAVYRAEHGDARVAIFFRDTQLSDAIGFWLHRRDPEMAAADLVDAMVDRARSLPAEGDYILTIALDGENAWGSYVDDGRPFLEALYRRLAASQELETTTCARFLADHPVDELPRVHALATASWIDEAGSRPGTDLGTWIGEPDENAAWSTVAEARAALVAAAGLRGLAYESLLAAEGSDWFWWLGADQDSGRDDEFDQLFRQHVARAYQLAGLRAPPSLARAAGPPIAVWTFTRKLAQVGRDHVLVVRTNCPGSLTWRVDDAEPVRATLAPTGGVLAGARRFQVALGPFPSGERLQFRFRCNDEECHCVGGCIPDEQSVELA
jgi:alpha-amylase/alpha-mannosidase (GH57 family)